MLQLQLHYLLVQLISYVLYFFYFVFLTPVPFEQFAFLPLNRVHCNLFVQQTDRQANLNVCHRILSLDLDPPTFLEVLVVVVKEPYDELVPATIIYDQGQMKLQIQILDHPVPGLTLCTHLANRLT
jgi:hypothetical protein